VFPANPSDSCLLSKMDTILALDTETGKTCVSYKHAALTNEGTPMPYCARSLQFKIDAPFIRATSSQRSYPIRLASL